MTLLNIIVVFILALSCIGILFYKIHLVKKEKKEISIENVIDEYGDDIVKLLQDFIKILIVDINEFESKEEYIKELVRLCVDSIKSNSDLAFDEVRIIKLLDTEVIADIVTRVLMSNKIECFSVLTSKEISINRFLFDNDIVEALVELEQEEAQEVYTDEVVISEYDPYKEFIEKITTEDIETENKSED